MLLLYIIKSMKSSKKKWRTKQFRYTRSASKQWNYYYYSNEGKIVIGQKVVIRAKPIHTVWIVIISKE